MTKTPRQSTFTVETGDGYRLEFTVKGFVDADAETFASEILAVAGHAFNDVYSLPFEEQVVEMFRHKVEALLEEEAKPSEFDQGWAAGRQAALLEVEPYVPDLEHIRSAYVDARHDSDIITSQEAEAEFDRWRAARVVIDPAVALHNVHAVLVAVSNPTAQEILAALGIEKKS